MASDFDVSVTDPYHSFIVTLALPCPLQINNLPQEWQYLFDQAGVTREMLEDKGTLQFILDTVFKLGGAPQKLDLEQGDGTYPKLFESS